MSADVTGAGVVITVRRDGPYRVRGPVVLVDHEGVAFEVLGGDVVLCRCGRSATKPFCDGTHRQVGFDGTCAPRPPDRPGL